jgi:hypothetical protein
MAISLGFPDVLSLAQTIAIIATLLITLYFSSKQIRSMTLDLETRVMNDLDEKLHSLIALSIDSPKLIKMVYDLPYEVTEEIPYAYYILFMMSHAYHMKQRNILSGNEWEGWLQWIKNAFRQGKLPEYWKDMESWFDPSFRNFINKEILKPTQKL